MTAVLPFAAPGTENKAHPGRVPTARGLIGLAIACLLVTPLSLRAQVLGRPQANPLKASVSQASREDATQAIPMDRLDARSRAMVQSVLSDVTIFRRMPVHVIQCDPEFYVFLIRHPDVVVNIWQVLKLSQISLEQSGPDTYRLADSAGTNGTVRILYHTADTHLVYVEGTYDGPLTTKSVHGRGLLLLKSGYVREADGNCYITTRLDTFMQVEPGGAELLTKAFQPLVGKIADLNFQQTAAFVGSLSKTAEVNGAGMRRLTPRLTNVQPEVRDQFSRLAERIAQEATGLTAVEPNTREPKIVERPAKTVTQ